MSTSMVIPKHVREATLGKRIRWTRQRAGLSHDRLGAAVGATRSHLIKIEKGEIQRPRLELRHRIADATGVPRDLFADDDEDDLAMTLDELLRLRVRQILREERAVA